jgi:hypothetical protein
LPYWAKKIIPSGGYPNGAAAAAAPRGEDVEAVEEIGAEAAGRDRGRQIAIGGRDDPDVHGHGLVAAHRLELVLLEDAEQLHLRLRR